MKSLRFLTLSLPLLTLACSSGNEEKDEISIENMVLNDTQDEEWVGGADLQEQIIAETPDAPLKENSTEACR